jgi:acetate kinase
MSDVILTLNAGSSSLKFALFAFDADGVTPEPLAEGEVAGLGAAPRLKITARVGGGIETGLDAAADHEAVLRMVLDWVEGHELAMTVVAAGHRIVHGGPQFHEPRRITAALIEALAALTPLAPLHQPHNLAPVRALAQSHPHLPQIACFDTGFHASNSALTSDYALPRELTAAGIRRYGFHGLSYEYIAGAMPQHLGDKARGRVVVAHLGGGASMCAIHDGRSVASTMGFSALDGLPMGTRCGAIDPGVLLYLMKEKGMAYDALTDLLYHRSGLLGVSGTSSDMRALLADPAGAAREAVSMFIYRIGRELGSLSAALGGLDALIFTGGIGEHAAPVRAGVCRAAEWLGVELDEAANAAHGPRITRADSPVPAFVIPTDEDLMIARHTVGVLQPHPA